MSGTALLAFAESFRVFVNEGVCSFLLLLLSRLRVSREGLPYFPISGRVGRNGVFFLYVS